MMLGHTALPFFIYDRLGGDERVSGTVAACLSLCYMIVCLIGAEWVRRSDNSLRIAAFGALGFGVLFGSAGLATNVYLFTLLTTAGFCSMALSWPTMHAWLGAEPNLARRAKLMAAFNIAWSCGMAVGALSAGPAYDFDYRLPFAALALLGVAAFCLLYTQPREADYFEPGTESDLEAAASSARSTAFLASTWIAVFVGFATLGAARSVYPKRLEGLVETDRLYVFFPIPELDARINLGAATLFSILAFAIVFTSAIVYVIMGRTERWRHRFGLIVVTQIAAALACFVMAQTHSLFLLYVCYTVLGANTYIAFFTGIFYAVAEPARKHRRAAINESLVGGGAFAGSLAAGWAAGLSSIATVFSWMPLIILAGIAVQLILLRRNLG